MAYRRSRVFSGVWRRLLVHRVEAALLLEADAVDAAALEVVGRGDAADLATAAVTAGYRGAVVAELVSSLFAGQGAVVAMVLRLHDRLRHCWVC